MRPIRQIVLLLAIFSFEQISVADDAPPVPTTPVGLHYYYPVPKASPPRVIEADLCVYGGSPGGIGAAIQATRQGKEAVLLVFNRHVGGLTSGGLTATDVGIPASIGGIATEFFRRVGKMRHFLPSEAETVFREMLAEAGVPVFYEHRLEKIVKEGTKIQELVAENGNRFRARIFVDATYEGDLLAAAGVSYAVGREARAQYGEKWNGVSYRDKHQFTVKVDPYREPGNPASGLLWGISPVSPPPPEGSADRRVQAYCFRMQLTDGPERLPFPKPAGYDRSRYELLLRYLKLQEKPEVPFELHVGDANNDGAFSTDYIGGNYAWPEADYATREAIFQDHVNYQQGLVWFVANDPEVPQKVRDAVNKFGLMKHEFPATGGWPHQLYIREGRRMVSDVVMTEHHCRIRESVSDPVGMGSYTMDSHNCQRLVIDGAVRNEGDVQIFVGVPYGISYRSIMPKKSECTNLLVPVCLSASHIAYGSIRMEPVFMILGQSAGSAAVLAIDGDGIVQNIDYQALREQLLKDGQILEVKPKGKGDSGKLKAPARGGKG